MSSSSPMVKKSKSFKRIRGFLKGRSGKSKKNLDVPKEVGAQDGAFREDDASTLYGVDVDDRSIADAKPSTPTKASKAEPSKLRVLKVVLLLMDPETRRFELLQLEFDSIKALVADVLQQIPVSVTEEVIKKQTFVAITSKDANEMKGPELLSSFCAGNDVLVAIPEGLSAKECVKLAKPILNDDKVVAMLLSSGIDAKPWRETRRRLSKKGSSKRLLKQNSKKKLSSKKDKSAKSESSFTFQLSLVVLVGLVMQVIHMYLSAPIKPGHVVSPGIWLSKCGLAPFNPKCENAFFNFDSTGKATMYGADKLVVWEIQGSTCDKGEDCVSGLKVEEDGTLVVGGDKITWLNKYTKDSVELAPWPFDVAPKLKQWYKKA